MTPASLIKGTRNRANAAGELSMPRRWSNSSNQPPNPPHPLLTPCEVTGQCRNGPERAKIPRPNTSTPPTSDCGICSTRTLKEGSSKFSFWETIMCMWCLCHSCQTWISPSVYKYSNTMCIYIYIHAVPSRIISLQCFRASTQWSANSLNCTLEGSTLAQHVSLLGPILSVFS